MILKDIRIGQFSDSFLPIMDGVAFTVRNYAQWLTRIQDKTYVITPSFPGYTDKEDFPVLRYFSTPLLVRKPYRMGIPDFDQHISQVLRGIPLDLVHAHSPFSAGFLAMKTARRLNIPVVATFHSKYRDDFGRFMHLKSMLKQIARWIVTFYESADEVWIPQPHVEDTIREYGYRGKLEVVENGIDLEVPCNISEVRMQSRQALCISTDKPVFLYVGQLILEKNLKFLVESLSHLNLADYSMYIVGEGYARPILEKLALEYGLSGRIRFTGPVYDREKLSQYYAVADLLLFPSLYDNAPLVLREAAAMHTPALLLKGATAAEVIQDGMNGFLSDNDPVLFAHKIMEIIHMPLLKDSAGAMAATTLCHSWKDIVGEVHDRYLHLLKRKRG